MTLYYDLDLSIKTGDPGLLDRIPQRLARYYLAFPLAEEDGRVTVITAHPENKAGLWVLRRLLNADIVPVSSPESAVRETIARIYSPEQPDKPTILAWAEDAAQREHIRQAAGIFSHVLNQPVTYIEGDLPFGEHLRPAKGEVCSLLVVGTANSKIQFGLLRGSSSSLLFVRGEPSPVKRMLVVLRGYGSDHQTIEHAMSLLAHEGAEVTVLSLLSIARRRVNSPTDEALSKTHLEACLGGLTRSGATVSLRLRQGNPVEQIVAELSQGRYDLLAIAAEARGDFVYSVLSRIDAAGVFPTQPILIVKPPVGPVSTRD